MDGVAGSVVCSASRSSDLMQSIYLLIQVIFEFHFMFYDISFLVYY